MTNNDISLQRPLVLASTSPYRAELLGRLGVSFEQVAPECDETPLPEESPSDLVSRLSLDKAASLAARYPDAVIIGSDQVADLNGDILGKPHTAENAVNQLQKMSDRTVVFRTGYCVMCPSSGQQFSGISDTKASFRPLTLDEVQRYVERDKPLDCAGAFRSEALGIGLLQSMQSDDPASIVGLPLIRIAEALRQFGISVP